MSDVQTKLLRGHRKRCRSLEHYREGTWDTPWAYMKERESRDTLGRAGGWRGWWRVICNDTLCPAAILVREDDLMAHLPAEEAR